MPDDVGGSVLLIFNFGTLFDLVVALTTRYGQPLLGLLMCVVASWIWQRNTLIEEICKGTADRNTACSSGSGRAT